MEAPRQLESAANEQDDIVISHREYEDESVITVDFGPGVEATLDIVDDTVIVVAGDRQFEFDRPAEAKEISTNDGMLIIKE